MASSSSRIKTTLDNYGQGSITLIKAAAYKPDWSDEKHQIAFRVKPRIAHAWKAPRMHRTLVNFLF